MFYAGISCWGLFVVVCWYSSLLSPSSLCGTVSFLRGVVSVIGDEGNKVQYAIGPIPARQDL